MSEVKVGDRVRITTESEVISVYSDGAIAISGNLRAYQVGRTAGVVSIEVIAPLFVLPTKRWAQVVDGFGYLWTLSSDEPDVWYSLAGNSLGRGGLLERSGIRVISEGLDDEWA
jgi:hypothetical protein